MPKRSIAIIGAVLSVGLSACDGAQEVSADASDSVSGPSGSTQQVDVADQGAVPQPTSETDRPDFDELYGDESTATAAGEAWVASLRALPEEERKALIRARMEQQRNRR